MQRYSPWTGRRVSEVLNDYSAVQDVRRVRDLIPPEVLNKQLDEIQAVVGPVDMNLEENDIIRLGEVMFGKPFLNQLVKYIGNRNEWESYDILGEVLSSQPTEIGVYKGMSIQDMQLAFFVNQGSEYKTMNQVFSDTFKNYTPPIIKRIKAQLKAVHLNTPISEMPNRSSLPPLTPEGVLALEWFRPKVGHFIMNNDPPKEWQGQSGQQKLTSGVVNFTPAAPPLPVESTSRATFQPLVVESTENTPSGSKSFDGLTLAPKKPKGSVKYNKMPVLNPKRLLSQLNEDTMQRQSVVQSPINVSQLENVYPTTPVTRVANANVSQKQSKVNVPLTTIDTPVASALGKNTPTNYKRFQVTTEAPKKPKSAGKSDKTAVSDRRRLLSEVLNVERQQDEPSTLAQSSGQSNVSAVVYPYQVQQSGHSRLVPTASNIRRYRRPVFSTRLTKGETRRLARRGGVKRISGYVRDTLTNELKQFLRSIVERCAIYAENAKRRTVMMSDVFMSLKSVSRTLYF